MWGEAAARALTHVPDEAVSGTWNALNFLCAAQLYLRDNPGMRRPLTPGDVKHRPSGHWGICPPVNLMLAALGPLRRNLAAGQEMHILHGGGHAGPSALAHAYLTGHLARTDPAFTRSAAGLHHLVTGFPHPGGVGSEITPLIGGHLHTGGQLGSALAIAQGTVLDAPCRLTIPLIGDGECETGATAAAWLAARTFHGTGEHGTVLPVVLLNGLRMGGPSLLSTLSPSELTAYFTGLGYRPIIDDGSDIARLRALLAEALAAAPSLGAARGGVVFVLTMPKGHTGPHRLGTRQLAGTPAMHKTPLPDPRHDPAQFAALRDWLSSYRPQQVLTGDGHPAPELEPALCGPDLTPPPADISALAPPRGCIAVSRAEADRAHPDSFGQAIAHVLRDRAAQGPFRLFSPDELASNRIHLAGTALPFWAVEVLNEELAHCWAQGYTETGRRAAVITYEAFAPITTSLICQQLKHRAARRAAHLPDLPSLVYLLTSLGWHNTFTHQNPALTSALIATGDPTLPLYTPADAPRAAATLTFCLRKFGRANIIIASKHPLTGHPTATLDDELRHGIALWPHLTDPETPDLVLASAGDLAAHQLTALAAALRTRQPRLRLRYLNIHDLTALGDPRIWPHALSDNGLSSLLTPAAPILLATIGHAADIHALLGRRHPGAWLNVLGYRDPGRPLGTEQLLAHCGLDLTSLTAQALTATEITTSASDATRSSHAHSDAPDCDNART